MEIDKYISYSMLLLDCNHNSVDYFVVCLLYQFICLYSYIYCCILLDFALLSINVHISLEDVEWRLV